jgi:redox-sensitive bicupin YhaK (pirin superfamily)
MSNSSLSRRAVVVGAAAAGSAALLASRNGTSSAPAEAAPQSAREVVKVISAQATSDGAGVRLARSLGSQALPMLDPFLMLDEFHTDRPDDYLAGFPDHPHRGFETVTYMIDGAMEHRDSLGNHGRLGPGSTQWMTAGSGIIHSEMPKQERGLMWGFQLWVNLPAANKMTKPRYQDIAPGSIPEIAIDDASVRLVAGAAGEMTGPVSGIVTAPEMLDVKLPKSGRFTRAVPSTHNVFAYVIEGEAKLGPQGKRVPRGQLAVFGPGETIVASSDASEGTRFLLLAGKPVNEPVARYGPFVMNTDAEIRKAIEDYRSGRLVERS